MTVLQEPWESLPFFLHIFQSLMLDIWKARKSRPPETITEHSKFWVGGDRRNQSKLRLLSLPFFPSWSIMLLTLSGSFDQPHSAAQKYKNRRETFLSYTKQEDNNPTLRFFFYNSSISNCGLKLSKPSNINLAIFKDNV